MNRQGNDDKKSGGFSADEGLPALHLIFHGQVASVQKYGVFVSIPGYKRHGLVHVSQMSSARIEDPAEMLAKGEKVYCKVISVETEGSKIGLSMKLVNQTTGQDLDPNNVQLSQDEKKRKRFFAGDKPPIELGAVYDTTCRNCGGHGHLAMECFVGKGTKQYDLVPELEDMVPSDSEPPPPPPPSAGTSTHARKKKKKKDKKVKKEKKKKRKRHSSSSDDSDSDSGPTAKKKKRKRHHSDSSDSSTHEKHRKHKKGSHKHRS
ncbi:zinc finger CCHC domain-containing protein 17-like [Babylonia areolata]|uniref:zinc finger CCHC domain-containing protein 17-like n=1 Tax=Babylonia areolata TaxID=304850 RepID=UPI003FD52B3F